MKKKSNKDGILISKETGKESAWDLNYIELMVSMGTWEMDDSREDVFWSDGFFRIHGLQPQSITVSAEQRMKMVHPDDREKLKKSFEEAYGHGTPYSLEKRILLPDGSIKWVLSKGEIKTVNGRKRVLRGVVIDINTHKLIEIEKAALESKQLRLKNEELQRSFNAFQEAVSKSSIVSYANKSGIIIDVNENFINISGFSREELIGQNHSIINSGHHPKSFWIEMWRKISRGDIWRGEVRNKAKNGTFYWVDTFIIPFLDNNNQIAEFLSIRNDITSRKETEKELLDSQKRAEKANEAKSEFLANMSHEIRTPLNGVIGFADLLSKTQLSKMQFEYVELVSQSANNLLDIVNNILDLSKIETGKLELNCEKTDMEMLCKQLMEMISLMAKSKNIQLVYNYSELLPKYVIADAFRIKQILLNLLANAIKFTERGTIELRVVSDKLNADNTGKSYVFRFEVRDTGIGIRKENFAKIFEVFSQEDSSVTKKYGGTGLGLSICNQLLHLMDSQLHVKSELGKGSVFSFNIQLDYVDSRETVNMDKPQGNKESLPATFANGSIKVLVVEDNAINRLLVKMIIKKISADVQIIEAENGLVAIEKYKEEKPDIILMDVQMPEMNGREATRCIRELESRHEEKGLSVPIIALTAAAMVDEKERCLEAGMDDFVTKPIANNAIGLIFEKWLVKKW